MLINQLIKSLVIKNDIKIKFCSHQKFKKEEKLFLSCNLKSIKHSNEQKNKN